MQPGRLLGVELVFPGKPHASEFCGVWRYVNEK
jgi:hypothetical protein